MKYTARRGIKSKTNLNHEGHEAHEGKRKTRDVILSPSLLNSHGLVLPRLFGFKLPAFLRELRVLRGSKRLFPCRFAIPSSWLQHLHLTMNGADDSLFNVV